MSTVVFLSGESSDEAELGFGVVEDDSAGRAVPARLHQRAADLMAGSLGPRVPGAPVAQQPEGPGEVLALLAEAGGETRRPLRVGRGDGEELLLQRLETLGQDVRRDARQRLDEVVEPSGALEQ